MKNEQFPFLLMDQNKNNQNDDSDFSEKKSRRSKKSKKKFELNQYEKFKPKNSNSNEKSSLYLEGAENKVKSLISIILKDMQQEGKNSDSSEIQKYMNKLGQKDSSPFKYKRREVKRNSVALKNDPNKLKNYQINKNAIESNIFDSVKDLSLYNFKKDGNVGSNMKNIYENNHYNSKMTTKNKKHKNNRTNNKLVGTCIGNSSFQVKRNLKEKTSLSDSIIGTILPLKKINKNLKRTSLNDSSNYNLLNSRELKLNDDNNYKRVQTSFVSRNKKLKKMNSSRADESLNNINNNLSNKKRKDNQNVIFIQSYDKSDDTNQNLNYFVNESINDSNANLKSKEEITITKPIANKNYEIIKKKYTSDSNNINCKTSTRNNNWKINSEINHLKRSNTDQKKKNQNPKFFKNNLEFRTIKKLLKKTIILRPEDISLNLKNNMLKSSKRRLKSNRSSSKSFRSSIKSSKSSKKSKSEINLLTVKNKPKYFPSLDNLNLKNISYKNKSSITNIQIKIPNEIKNIPEIKPNSINNSIKDLSEQKSKKKIYNLNYRMMRRKPILYDSLDDEECEDAEEINHLFIHPNSKFILIFDSLLALSALISFIIVPFYLAQTHSFCRNENFLDLDFMTGINIVIEFLNFMDLLISFCRGYYNWEEVLIFRKRSIIKHYLGKYFFIDLVSAVPIYTLSKIYEPFCNRHQLSSSYYNHILNNLHYLLLSNRLLKIYKIFNDNQAYKHFSNHINEIVDMIINIISILLALNYAGCLHIFIARNCYPNWILKTNLDTSSFIEIYICSIYVLMMAMTTVGYGDITCYSFGERIFQVFLLIIGILAYSYAVTSFSNYIQKINEKSADYEKKKSILDEIKLTNPNLPEELYDKILRFLKFRNFHEKKLKNIIFDCLPISLKNNLICEMYKPIIKNFIFFKNFQNTDFIVRVILAYRPILADKNDILINDNDLVEDIMFVKHGILSVELPLNSTNPQENIDKYINMPILNGQKGEGLAEKPGKTTLIYSRINSNLNKNIKNPNFSKTITFLDPQKNNTNSKGSSLGFNSNFLGTRMGTTMRNTSTFGNKISISEKEEKDDIKYVRILCIRENEHFGDVMMFLEQRSPLRVRVKSKKAELFFLKKMDAIKISASYPNIWRRINKKSVFNFEQIKKSINKIVEIYCSVKKLNSIQEENSSNSIYSELIRRGKIGKEETEINTIPKNFASKFQISDISKKGKKSNTLKLTSTNSIKHLLNHSNFDNISESNLSKKRAYSSRKLNQNKLNFLNKGKRSSFSPSIKSKNSNKKVTFGFMGKNQNLNNNYTINEDPSNEDDALSQLRSNKSTNLIKPDSSPISKNNKNELIENKYESKYNRNKKMKKKSNNKIEKNYTLKSSKSSSLQLINDENFNIFNKSDDNSSDNYSYDNNINNEIYPNEEIIVNKEENLFLRRAHFPYPIKKFPMKIEADNNVEYKNSKIEYLLKSFDDNEENKNSLVGDNSSNNIYEKKKSYNDLISQNSFKLRWENCLSINNNISFNYEASYENCNIISGEKLLKNKFNQLKLKNFLIEEILHSNKPKRNSLLILKNKTMNININTQSKPKEKEKQENSGIKTKNKLKKCSSLIGDLTKMSASYNSLPFKRTASFNENTEKNSLVKNNFQEGLSEPNSNTNHLTQRKQNKVSKKKFLSSKYNFLHSGLITLSADKNKKLNRKNSFKSPTKNKKKRDNNNILSKINLNIQKTNQNLNNPDEFYSNYFHSLLEGENKNNNNNLYRISLNVLPKFKKDKTINNIKKNATIKK